MQDGPLPLVEDQQLPVKSQRQMTQEYMQIKWQKQFDALTHEQQLVFCDNVAAIKILNAVPKVKYRFSTFSVLKVKNVISVRLPISTFSFTS